MTNKTAAVILAAGKGKRMKSDLPKVLHRVDGKPLIRMLLENLAPVGLDRIIVVIGHKGELVMEELKDMPVEFVWQREQKGTGHAVRMAEKTLEGFEGTILVAAGDAPFLKAETVKNLFAVHLKNKAAATCLSAEYEDPTGYGRVIRKGDSDILLDIVEHKDASEEIKKITEINSGTFCFDSRQLFKALREVGDDNAQKEYYLTDTIKIMQGKNLVCAVVRADDALEAMGINSADQLREAEAAVSNRKL
jgi:UDP-N-acetylglucosamine diphosphorylase/glucosamine-1-phosphate N-acetyltransferase